MNDYICIVLAGGFAEWKKGSCRERRKGCFFIHGAGETHHDHFGPNGAVCLSLHLQPGQSSSHIVEGTCSTTARLAADAIAFELAAGNREELVVAAIAAELIGELGSAPAAAGDSGDWIDRLVEAISDDPLRRWSLKELAHIVQRHPVRMAQGFRARTGLSIGLFQRRRRLLSLCLALRREKTPLAVLAAEYGYCDQSHMNSEFRAALGTSPGKYRQEFH